MAKKNEAPIISPAQCVQALDEYNKRIFMLLNLLPDMIDFMKEAEHKNKELQSYLIKNISINYANVMEYRNAYLEEV